MEEAIDANILAAGDNCSRAAVIGALFGAAKSALKSGYPLHLLDKMDPKLLEDISQLAIKVYSASSSINSLTLRKVSNAQLLDEL